MTFHRAVILVSIVLFAGSGVHAQRRILPPGAAVLGQVVDAHTGRGLTRVIVEIDGPGLRRQLVTDERGRFLFTGLPDGDYQIHASRSGYLNGSFGQRRAAGDSSTISLVFGQWVNNVDVTLWRPAVLTGYVTDDAGTPLIGITVRAYRHDRRAGHAALREAGRAVTDDTGAYRLGSLIPGDHLVGISMPRLNEQDITEDITEVEHVVFAPMYYPAAERVVGASTVIAEAGRDFAGINFTLPTSPLREIKGQVDPASVPEGEMSAVRLVLARPLDPFVAEAPAHRVLSSAVPDPNGHFVFSNVPPGEFAIEAILSSPGPEASAPEDPPPTAPSIHWAHQPVSIGVGNSDESATVIVALRPGMSVEGRTRVVSADGRRVLPTLTLGLDFEPLFEAPGVRPMFTGTTAAGDFRSSASLIPGRYLVRVAGIPEGWRLRAVTAGGIDVSDEALDLSSGYAPPDLTIELTDQLTLITGTVRSAGPLADAGASVLLFPQGRGGMASRRYHSARTSNDGTFTFRNVPAGSYLIAAVDESEAGGWQAPERLQMLTTRATPVLLRDGEAKVLELRRVRAR